MRSVLPSADLFRRSRLSSATIKLFPVLNYVMSRPWLRARQLPRPRRKKKKTGKRLKHVSLCTQHHNLARKTWQNFLMNGWSNLCEQCLNRFLACLLSFKTRPGFENNLSHARMVQLVFLLLEDITSLYRLKIYSIYKIQFRLHFIAISLDIMSRSLLCPASTFLLV